MSIRATHAPESALARHGGPEPTVRYASGIPWPGITSGHDARCSCTWAMRKGVYQVKFADAGCLITEHHYTGGGR